jgi:uncharacterized protein
MDMSTPAVAGPVRPAERILTLDIIRGFALLGIFVMNMPYMSGSFHAGADGAVLWPAWWDQAALRIRDVLFDGKFNSMFSFLFAIGFTIQLARLEQRQPGSFTAIYVRRVLLLLLFGLIHACLIWAGDVLHIYALFGLLLLLIRGWSDRTIVGAIGMCLLYPSFVSALRLLTRSSEDVERLVAVEQAHEASNNAAFGAGSFLDAAVESTRETILFYTDPTALPFTFWFYVTIATTMLLGLLAGRHQWIQRANEHLPLVRRVQWWSLLAGVGCGVVVAIGNVVTEPFTPSPLKILTSTCYAVARVSLMMFYVATIVRLAANERWRRRLRPIAAAGRMPLTNYLLQSVIGTFIFYGWGLGLWGQVGYALQLALAFAVFFLLQVPLSVWWFRHFSYGPMEYVWRVLTYGRRPEASPQTQPA